MIKLLNNRNTLLLLSLFFGLVSGWGADFFKPYTLLVLAIVMVFSTTSFEFKLLRKVKLLLKTSLLSLFLNYILFGVILLFFAYLLIPEKEIFWGFVIIAATPPGVAIIPFTIIHKGNLNYSLLSVLGVYLMSIVISPLIIKFFISGAEIKVIDLMLVMVQVIIVPLILSRLLLFKKIKPVVDKIRGKVVNWGFAIILYTAVGLNRNAIFSDIKTSILISLVLIITMFLGGILYEFITRKFIKRDIRISQNLIFTIKSSGFAAGTSLALFGGKSAMPAAFLSVFVIIYLIVIGFIFEKDKKS